MAQINWYQVRHYVKWTLIGFTILFFLVNIIELLAVKQFYIKRYLELRLMQSNKDSESFDGHHKVFQVDEEIDLSKFNLTETGHANGNHINETSINLPAEHREPISTLDELPSETHPDDEDNNFSVEVKFFTGMTVAALIVIQMLYCILYLYIIAQKRFCSMLCFAILSLLSLLFLLQLHLTVEQEEESSDSPHSHNNNSTTTATTSGEHHSAGTFFKHINSLEQESLINHITHVSLPDVALSVIETILAFVYSALLYKFPGRRRSQHHRLGFFRLGGGNGRVRAVPLALNGRLPNGHAVAVEMHSIDEQNADLGDNQDDDDSISRSSVDSSASLHAIDARQMADEDGQVVDSGSNPLPTSTVDRPLIDGDGSSSSVVVR